MKLRIGAKRGEVAGAQRTGMTMTVGEEEREEETSIKDRQPRLT
jgi:hypothetical protein